MPAMTTGDANPIGVLAHAGGWDEILLILAPLALFAFLLWLAWRRAQKYQDPTDHSVG
jgi:cyanate permease